MKRSELLKLLKKNGVVFVRSGGSHDIYFSHKTGKEIPVPRHKKEIPSGTVFKILRESGIK